MLGMGGKRIRPSLVLLACDLFNSDYRIAINPAIGIEIFHNFTLLHDDLMDYSSFRRNNPTVHTKWDQNTAILSGDVMSFLANKFISNVDPRVLVPVNYMFNKTAIEVCEGQMLDMEYSVSESITIPQYLNMIRLKTAVLIASSLSIGALVAEAPEAGINQIYNFGLNLGIAFQLQDDLLDIFGNEEILGKKIGNDIITNKRTYLFIRALEKSDNLQREELSRYYSGINFESQDKIEKVTKIFKSLDIKDETEVQINKHFNIAMEYLDAITIERGRKLVLTEFSEYLMKREK
jgi:geranylgeranyl diphosphate synthase type II